MNDREKQKQLQRDLRELARVQPQAAATARAIERARLAVHSTTSDLPSPRDKIMTLRNLAAVAAVLVAIAFVRHWLTPASATEGLAFGAVQEKVEKTKSVQYFQTRKDFIDDKAAPQETRKVKILGPHQMWEEAEITTDGDPLPKGHSWGTSRMKYTMINNLQTGKMITLYPDKKAYDIPKIIYGIDLNSGEVKEQKVRPAPEVDFYKRIHEFPADTAKKLPDRTIDGKASTGFQTIKNVERGGGTEIWTKTYWVNPATKLPVRIETLHERTESSGTKVRSEWVLSEIVFDAPLDEALFSTDPPAGYKDLTTERTKKEEAKKAEKKAAPDEAK